MASTFAISTPAYTATARALHWLTAAFVLVIIPVGLVMSNFASGPTQDFLFHIHRSLGAILIPIILFRFYYRMTHTPAPLPADIPAIQRLAAESTHWALYGLLLVQPLLGWVATSAYRAPILIFWTFQLPPIWPESRALSEQLFVFHKWIGISIALLLCAHIGGALFHYFIRKDAVLQRMLRG